MNNKNTKNTTTSDVQLTNGANGFLHVKGNTVLPEATGRRKPKPDLHQTVIRTVKFIYLYAGMCMPKITQTKASVSHPTLSFRYKAGFAVNRHLQELKYSRQTPKKLLRQNLANTDRRLTCVFSVVLVHKNLLNTLNIFTVI